MKPASALALVAIIWLTPAHTRACSCANVTIAERCAASAAGFSARVHSVEPDGGRYRVRLHVVRVFHGEVPDVVDFFMGVHPATRPPDQLENSCELLSPFEVGDFIQILLDEPEQRLILVCTHARVLASAEEAGHDPCEPAEPPEPVEQPRVSTGCASCATQSSSGAGTAPLILVVWAYRRRHRTKRHSERDPVQVLRRLRQLSPRSTGYTQREIRPRCAPGEAWCSRRRNQS